MKFLFIGMTKDVGGTETFIMNTARFLWQKDENEVFFLNIENGNIAYQKEIIENGGTILNYKIHKGVSGLIYNSAEANRFFSSYNFDVVHINANILRTCFWAAAAKKHSIKHVFFHAHNSSYGKRSFLKKITYSIIGYFDRISLKKNAITLLAASQAAGHWMFHNQPFNVVHNGVNTSKFRFDVNTREKLRKNFLIKKNQLVFISVARFSFQKNHEKILDIFKKILDYETESILVLVGEGPLMYNMEKKAKELGIWDSVIFTGKRNDVPNLLSMSDTMIFPSRYEGTPYSLMEAQSSGLNIVVSNEAFNQTSNITNKLKFLSVNDESEKWAKAILKFGLNEISAERWADNKKIEDSKYSLKSFEQELNLLYEFKL